ncbi:Thioredoxin-like fold protein [Ascosphaera apis ARSEF 7405]|uniref:Thioredoxin-like fold protein n=1 Tax=Ascosphaera apis ARSEF 7405 TaxID=392613 RepID=A0A166NKN7_9EURO|nr:Thioredoxin-like fold protein [Ascosphaera apis ARSEF 7405]
MFSMPRSLDVITLFHNPSLRSSIRALDLLKRASALAQESSSGMTFNDAEPNSETSSKNIPVPGNEFELEVTTKPPTEDQLNNIFDYLGATAAIPGKPSEIVQGARDREEAIRKVMADGSKFIRPVVVDWSNGKAVLGGNESLIIRMLKELPQ